MVKGLMTFTLRTFIPVLGWLLLGIGMPFATGCDRGEEESAIDAAVGDALDAGEVDPDGSVPPGLYAAGYIARPGGVSQAGYWKDGEWFGLLARDALFGEQAQAIGSAGSRIVLAGYADRAGGTVARLWTDGKGVDLRSPAPGQSSRAFALAIDADGKPVVGGASANSSGIFKPGRWLEGVWSEWETVAADKPGSVFSMITAGNDLLAIGSHADSSNISIPGLWVNGAWQSFEQPDSRFNCAVRTVLFHAGEVYAGGNCRNNAGVAIPGYWRSGAWHALPSPVANRDADVLAGVVHQGQIQWSGRTKAGGAVENLLPGLWKEEVWVPLPPVFAGQNSFIQAMASDGVRVLVGGSSTDQNGVTHPGFWIDGTWNAQPVPFEVRTASVTSVMIR